MIRRALTLLAATAAAFALTACEAPIAYQDGDYVIRGWVPAGATVYEDGSYTTPYGYTGCIPTAPCAD